MIEEKVFERKKFILEKLLQYGFCKVDDGYKYEADFMEGNFHAILFVTDENAILSKVIDVMNSEEYARLRAEDCNDAFVRATQSAYVELLKEIAKHCCKSVPFAFEQANRIAEKILVKYDVAPDFPWIKGTYKKDKNYGVFRHKDTKKWFAIIMNISFHSLLKNNKNEMVDVVNLKVDNAKNLEGRDGIYPAYHMSHKNWVSITLNDKIKDDEIMEFIEMSFNLTHSK